MRFCQIFIGKLTNVLFQTFRSNYCGSAWISLFFPFILLSPMKCFTCGGESDDEDHKLSKVQLLIVVLIQVIHYFIHYVGVFLGL